ncbi:voltage-gated potassium channel [Laetiporus sulphureus 93-53]|uniref:Voltage-gated potassium channel n=1 Tax=Laetiporus sulphureus 93-53 TaxID=1314785 RepID=A0A165FP19_9APHY|nr:voltage-gated potassium channel [Laetiporus sulphureus 93-53]KZT09259.1 voltage-gated potassium channel [Laetiporus sulphureus 93-53]
MSESIPLARVRSPISRSHHSPMNTPALELEDLPPSTSLDSIDDEHVKQIRPLWKRNLYMLLERPTSSQSAFLVHVVTTSLIILSAIVTVLETIPSFHSISPRIWFGFETTLVVLFTAEYVARCIAHSTGLWTFLRWFGSFFGIIDLLGILPYYIEIALQQDTATFFRFTILRTFRLLRVFRPFRYNNTILLTIEVMYLSFRRSQHALLALGFFVGMVLIVFSTLLYFAERGTWDEMLGTFINSDGDPSQFAVAITTVGYGEITPRSFLGRLITLPLLVFGLLLIALPTFVLGREFSMVWEMMKEDQVSPTTIMLTFLAHPLHRKSLERKSSTPMQPTLSPRPCSSASTLLPPSNQPQVSTGAQESSDLRAQMAELKATVETQDRANQPARRHMELVPSVSRSSGLDKDGDALRDFTLQEEYREFIQGKLREGLLSTNRKDAFALEVYETSLYLSVLFRSFNQTTSIISHLLPHLYITPSAPSPSPLQPHRALGTALLSLLHYLVLGYPSQSRYYEHLHSLPRSFLLRDSDAYQWLSDLARCLWTRDYTRLEALTRREAFKPFVGSEADQIPAPQDAAPKSKGAEREIKQRSAKQSGAPSNLALEALCTLIDSLRAKARETTWRVLRSAYRELHCLPPNSTSKGPSSTSEWLAHSLTLASIWDDDAIADDNYVAKLVDEWLTRKCAEGEIRQKEGVEGRWTVCRMPNKT